MERLTEWALLTLQDFLKSCSPDAFRLFCMRTSYRAGEGGGGAGREVRWPAADLGPSWSVPGPDRPQCPH